MLIDRPLVERIGRAGFGEVLKLVGAGRAARIGTELAPMQQGVAQSMPGRSL